MTDHLIWTAGLLGHLLLLGVLFMRKRVHRFPWFTLLVVFDLLRSVAVALYSVRQFTIIVLDLTDILLQCAVLAELTWIALRPIGGLRRFTLPLLLAASGVLIVMRLAPSPHSIRAASLLAHFLLAVLMVEWSMVLAFLLRPLQFSWRSHVVAISLGFGVYSAALLAGGGYFTTGREMRDYIFFSFFRIVVYLLVVVWWALSLWLPERRGTGAPRSPQLHG
jgi:hypothetical protein